MTLLPTGRRFRGQEANHIAYLDHQKQPRKVRGCRDQNEHVEADLKQWADKPVTAEKVLMRTANLETTRRRKISALKKFRTRHASRDTSIFGASRRARDGDHPR